MQLTLERSGDVHVVRVEDAKLTYPVLSSFFERMARIVEDGARKVVIDLQAVSFIDSESIGCLVEIQRKLKYSTGALKLAALQPRVAVMLSLAGVDRVLDVHGQASDAVAAFGGRSARGD